MIRRFGAQPRRHVDTLTPGRLQKAAPFHLSRCKRLRTKPCYKGRRFGTENRRKVLGAHELFNGRGQEPALALFGPWCDFIKTRAGWPKWLGRRRRALLRHFDHFG